MESMNPALSFLLALKFGIERGVSVRQAAQEYLQTETKSELSPMIAQWLSDRASGRDPRSRLSKIKSPYRKTLFQIFDRGLQGESIHGVLVQMEIELSEAQKQEMDEFLASLPLKMLIPLLFFQFPAFLLVLFGPLLRQFLTSF